MIVKKTDLECLKTKKNRKHSIALPAVSEIYACSWQRKWVVPEQSQALSSIYPPNKTIEETPNICLATWIRRIRI